MRTRVVMSLLLALFLGNAVKALGNDFKDIPYVASSCADSVGRRILDIHCPVADTPLPVVIWFHGGGLTGGEKAVPQALRDKGLVIVAPSYRLMPEASVDEVIDDAAKAVAWTFANIADYGGDPSRIIVSGHSAGGYLTSMIGLDRKWLARYGVDADSIKALIPYSGQVITHFAERDRRGIGNLQPVVDEYAPLFHVRKDAPPYIMITGDRETELFGRYEENAYMMRMMRLTGHPDVRIYEIGGHDHGAMVEPAHHILLDEIRTIL